MADLATLKALRAPGGRGTAHMVSLARDAGVRVIEIDEKGEMR